MNKAIVNENRIIRQHENNDLRLRYSTWPNKGELDTNTFDDFSRDLSSYKFIQSVEALGACQCEYGDIELN